MSELYHHGIIGQKWGVRRFQNSDGSLTSAGKQRYSSNPTKNERKMSKYRDANGNLTSAGKMRYREDGTKLTLENMSDEEYDYAMKQMRREKEFRDMKRSSGETGKFGKSDAVKLGVTVVASSAATVLKEALSDEGIQDGKKLAKKILLASGLTAIGSVATSLGGNVDNSYSNNSGSYKSGNSNSNNSGSYKSGNSNSNSHTISADKKRNISEKVGSPKGYRDAEHKKAYDDLFRKNPTEEQRALIKSMKKEGYSPDQIEAWVFGYMYQSGIVYKRLGNSKWGYVIT